MRDNKYFDLQSLLEISANIVANTSENIFKTTNSAGIQTGLKLEQANGLNDNLVAILPPSASEAVFEKLCDSCRSDSYKKPTFLAYFFDSHALPLKNIDLSSIMLSSENFVDLIKAQQKNVVTLNLLNTKGIESSLICTRMHKELISLKQLKTLKVNSTHLLQSPSLTSASVSASPSPDHYDEKHAPSLIPHDRLLSLQMLPPIDQDDSEHIEDNISLPVSFFGMDGRLQNRDDFYESQEYEDPTCFTSFTKNLEHLYLLEGLSFNLECETRSEFLERVLEPLDSLETLDLSEWRETPNLSMLMRFNQLTTLILYDVSDLENQILFISKIETISSLDLSQSDRSTGIYNRPVTSLQQLVCSLKYLECLDISGTNLTCMASENDRPHRRETMVASDIPGLLGLAKPLRYLGIFNCDNASHFKNIPADMISGDHGEDQILMALRAYMERPKTMQSVLNECFQLYKFGTNLMRYQDALFLVIEALVLHSSITTLQIAGTASLFYIIREVPMNKIVKHRVIQALLNAIEKHFNEQVLVRNSCLCLCQFEIPQEIMKDYVKVANLLVRILTTHYSDQMTQRIVVILLNSMACHVEGTQKVELGNLGAIEVILQQIYKKIELNICDVVMEHGWSFLWNVTDETPINCKRFIDANGLSLFKKCYDRFPAETELVRNMMGLIGNIAEVQSLRKYLMDDGYLSIFCPLLDCLLDGSIEISYNSAGVLSHLVSDGDPAWIGVVISRQDVMQNIINATIKWDLKARRSINYRSFKPILRLVPIWDSPGSQQWAVWALANLTTTDPSKYCPFMEEEGGIELLEELLQKSKSTALLELAQIVFTNIKNWRTTEINQANQEGNTNGLEMVE